jgi:hypothetical protein
MGKSGVLSYGCEGCIGIRHQNLHFFASAALYMSWCGPNTVTSEHDVNHLYMTFIFHEVLWLRGECDVVEYRNSPRLSFLFSLPISFHTCFFSPAFPL